MAADPGRSIAVIGAGVSGLTASYLLQRRHQVTLFERDNRLGGHAHTHDVPSGEGDGLAVDSGFIVCNPLTYPTFMRFLAELGVQTTPTKMGMSVRCGGCGLTYAGGHGLRGLLAVRPNAANLRFVHMLSEIVRFQRKARRLLGLDPDVRNPTLETFLREVGFSDYFRAHYLVPVVSAVWSVAPRQANHYPARFVFQFLANHGMLSVHNPLQWHTIPGGSRTYVDRAVRTLAGVRVSTPVRSVIRHGDGIELRDDADRAHFFDRVVIATHADQALRLLANPSSAERSVLGAFQYSGNEAVLHRDGRLLPSAPAARMSWNYFLPDCSARSEEVVVTYNMNRLQQLPGEGPVLVSLNASDHVAPNRVVARCTYHHPIYTPDSVAAQSRLPALNQHRIAFAGAYHGWGFHEDGCRAGAAAATSFGVRW